MTSDWDVLGFLAGYVIFRVSMQMLPLNIDIESQNNKDHCPGLRYLVFIFILAPVNLRGSH